MCEKVIIFIKDYADKFHHLKEEDVLFVEFGKNLEDAHCDPTKQMLYEHEQGRNFVVGMEESLKEENKDKLISTIIEYVEHHDHYKKQLKKLTIKLHEEYFSCKLRPMESL